MLEVMLITGISTVVGVIFIMAKAGLRKCLEHDLLIDIAVTALLIYVFSGSTTGHICFSSRKLYKRFINDKMQISRNINDINDSAIGTICKPVERRLGI